jgi:hypothetical protein
MRIAVGLFAVILAAALESRAAEPVEGRWEGVIPIPGTPLGAVIDLEQSGGQWIGSATVPGITKGSQLTDIQVQGPAISFTLKGALGDPKFSGAVDKGMFTGTFTQAGNRAPFQLRRSGSAQVDLPRQSTAVTPDLAGEWQGDLALNGNKLKATLKLANQDGGKASARFVVVGKRETNIPIDLVRQEGEFLTVNSSLYHITFEGRFSGGQLKGTFAQGPVETPLSLRRP